MIAQINRSYIKLGFLTVYQRLLSYFMFEGRPLTTRGRWINSLVFFIFRIFNLLPVLNPEISPVFLVGIGRSGTTILGKLLSAHSKIGYLNEPKAIWHHSFGNEDLVGNYASPTTETLLRPDLTTDQNDALKLKKLYSWYQKLARTAILVDKYPELIFRVDELMKIFPQTKFIAIVRNGYAVGESIYEWSERHGDNEKSTDWWGQNDRKWNIFVHDILSNPKWSHFESNIKNQISYEERGVIEWWYSMNELQFCIEKFPENFHIVRYEDLCDQPEKEINKVLNYIGVSMESKMMTFVEKEINSVQRTPKSTLVPTFIKEEFIKMQVAFGYETK